jgi:hypothetical protein
VPAKIKSQTLATRQQLLREIMKFAREAIYGTLSESYRTCGNPGCRCHHGGPKHGPHLYISHRGESGKTTGYHVPKTAETHIRKGVEAWAALQERLRQLALLNKELVIPVKAKKSEGSFRNRL